jgi:hypothetical protein
LTVSALTDNRRRDPVFQVYTLLRIGFVVAAWLGGIVVNLLTVNPPEYYDIALRDFGLVLAAVALGRLALAFRTSEARKPAVTAEPARRAA